MDKTMLERFDDVIAKAEKLAEDMKEFNDKQESYIKALEAKISPVAPCPYCQEAKCNCLDDTENLHDQSNNR